MVEPQWGEMTAAAAVDSLWSSLFSLLADLAQLVPPPHCFESPSQHLSLSLVVMKLMTSMILVNIRAILPRPIP